MTMDPVYSNMLRHLFQRSRLVITLLAFSGLLLVTRQHAAPVATVTPTPSASYMLMTVQGVGGGKYPVGSTVHVWANPPEQGWTFDTWTGDVEVLPDTRSMHLALAMPPQNVKIEALYKPVAWNVSFARMFARDVYYYFPTNAYRGVIVFFHGSGSNARDWLDFTERKQFLDDVVAAGYAVIAIDSTDRIDKQWDLRMPPEPNQDLSVVKAILTAFRVSGQISPQAPVYGVGMSRGGRFASLAAYELGMKATAIWVGLGHEEAMKVTSIPTLWCLANHDPIIDTEAAFSQYQQLLERHVDALFYVHPQNPLYPQNFVGIEGIDQVGSEQLFAELQAKGYLDQHNYLKENPRISRWDKEIGLEYSEATRLDIQDRLFVAFAEHTFYSDCDRRVLDFFASHP